MVMAVLLMEQQVVEVVVEEQDRRLQQHQNLPEYQAVELEMVVQGQYMSVILYR
jgi:hypothetical protein